MAASLWVKLKALLGKGEAPATASEVAVTSCALETGGSAPLGGLFPGAELGLAREGGRVAAMHCGIAVGFVPEREGIHLERLMTQGAALGCRVVQVSREMSLVRVRISILMS